MIMLLVQAMLLWPLVTGAALPAETDAHVRFVAMDGNDSSVGSREQPWQTISKANQELRPGDTVYIREGTYNEFIAPANSGQPVRKIT
jgi:molybdopterin biosynthesis enzyme